MISPYIRSFHFIEKFNEKNFDSLLISDKTKKVPIIISVKTVTFPSSYLWF